MKTLLVTLLLGVAFIPSFIENTPADDTPTAFYFENQKINTTTVFQFNSGWNAANKYQWVETPKAKYFEVDLEKDPTFKAKYNIKSVPTIIIFKDGKEFKRYEGGLQMKITIPIQVIQKDL